jgi:putative isomerase
MTVDALPRARHWSTWDAGRPAEFMHLPSGTRLTPVAYSARNGTATHFPPGASVTYGAHALDSSFVDLKLAHAGTILNWSYRKPEPEILVGSWSAEVFGEWALRFWLCLCVSASSGISWTFNNTEKILHAQLANRHFALACRHAPLLVTAHDDLLAAEQELQLHGYWYLKSRASEGTLMALRFNLEEMPANDFAAAVGDSLDQAASRARKALAVNAGAAKQADAPLAALRDIVAWNTVWDPVNRRPYTSCSRNWDLRKFGGYGVWLTDTAVSAFAHAHFGEEQAMENLEVLFAGQTDQGNFPCLLTGNDAWLDRSQPPIVGLIVWLIYLRTGRTAILERCYDRVLRNHEWWWQNRDGNGNAILEYGSSALGTGLYVGTKLAAKNESFMDNSPVHDEAQWIEASRTLDSEDVGLNSLIALDAEMLGYLAAALGRDREARDHHSRSAAHGLRVKHHFWDASRGIFANRLWNGGFVKSLSPTSFFPLLIGAADPRQIASLMRHLSSREGFGGRYMIPSVSRSDPAFRQNVYWRGRIWPILNWLVWLGLKRNGLDSQAQAMQRKSRSLFAASWKQRLAPENFNATTGQGLDQPDSDPFYSWTALLPIMEIAEVMDINPWDGWCLRNGTAEIELGPINSPIGAVTVSRRNGWLRLSANNELLFETTVQPEIKGLTINARSLRLMLAAKLASGARLRSAKPIAEALQANQPFRLKHPTHDLSLRATRHGPELLELTFSD